MIYRYIGNTGMSASIIGLGEEVILKHKADMAFGQNNSSPYYLREKIFSSIIFQILR